MVSSQTSKSSILDKIVTHKQKEVANMRDRLPLSRLQHQIKDPIPARDFLGALKQSPNKPSLITEVKKASPSKGIIRADFKPVEIAKAYENAGAACISVLCDRKFFQGGYDNLLAVRQNVSLPLLCKEFIIDPYQICWARACGADAILLIAAILSDLQLQSFLQIARSLGMEALVEVHTLEECDRALQIPELRLLGINNRNLETFSVELKTTEQILSQRREQLKSREITIVSESGLYVRSDLDFVAQSGANAVLIGESLVKQPDVEEAVRKILKA
ncbi:indole-3-glycerol phosphate synthase TrpC [Candidatus Gracilibacteria bacterium]|nr:indole-3-glycerol phosphate synthase TrpC [Candidatus Gracilibacteria bacterium]